MTDQAPRARVVVTGAAGIIGRGVADRLAADYDVLGIVRRHAADSSVASLHVDLTDLEATVGAFEGATAVVHLAAVAKLDAQWDDVLDDNIVATYNVFEAARRQHVKRVVFASSHHVVGTYEADGAPGIYDPTRTDVIGIDAAIRPDSLYAVSKSFGEALGRFYHERFGMAVICLRIGVVRDDDDPASDAVASSAPWLVMAEEDRYARARAVWLSKRDAAELVRSALQSPETWAVVYGTSDNPRILWDASPARTLLGYRPADRPRTHD